MSSKSYSKTGGKSAGKPTSHKPTSKAPSQRQLRVSELVRHALSQLLMRGDIHDDVLARYTITIPEVRLSPDLKLATAYVMPLGGKGEDEVIAALEKHKKFLRTQIAHRVNLKFAPELRFRRDETFDEADRIDAILARERERITSLSLSDPASPSSDGH
jgi:ribosome-binding factor A